MADNSFYVAESNDDKPSQPYTTIDHVIGSFYNSPWNQIRWSPDSQKVAIMYQRTNQTNVIERFSLDIIDKSGKSIRQYSSRDYWYPAITWRACEHESIVTKGQHWVNEIR